MSNSSFENALCSLTKCNDNDHLYKILVTIRKEVDWPEKEENLWILQTNDCLKHIVGCLGKRPTAIINTTLSILGNCCMVREIAKELVRKHNLLTSISLIIKRFWQDSIRGRAFRILGNLCHHRDNHCSILLKKDLQLHIITNLVNFLKTVGSSTEFYNDSTQNAHKDENMWSNATVCMVIRTLREVVNPYTIETLVEHYEVVKAIGMIVIKFTPKWVNDKENQDILQSALKLLLVYSAHRKFNIISELQNCGNGNSILCLSKLIVLSPYVVVKIIMNLSIMSNLRSDLPIEDIASSLVIQLDDAANFRNGRKDMRHREFIKCLCFLMHDPANKKDLRNAGLIEVFIKIIKEYVEENEISLKNSALLVASLRVCMYDKASLLQMLKSDIINVLISKLCWAVGSDNIFDLRHTKVEKVSTNKRRKCLNHSISICNFGHPCYPIQNGVTTSYSIKDNQRCVSPISDISFLSEQSCSSNPVLSANGDSDDYSPVCSDAEDKCRDLSVVGDEDNMASNVSPHYEDIDIAVLEDIVDWSEDITANSLRKMLFTLCIEIVKLIKLFLKLRPVVNELVLTDLPLKLLRFMLPKNYHLCPPEILGLILSIIKIPEYLIPLLQTDFVLASHQLCFKTCGANCVVCKRLEIVGLAIYYHFTMMVESERGKGDIAYQLHRGSHHIKQKLVYALPYVTGSTYIYEQLLINCRGLDTFLQAIQEEELSTQLKKIHSLSVLAVKLGIKSPVLECKDGPIWLPNDVDNYKLDKDCSAKVCFKLDDGSIVEADRNFLSEKSEYFSCLLYGMFKESSENEVVLHNVPNKPFKLLLLLLQFGVTCTDVYNIDVDLQLILDVVALSESYVLSDICSCLTLSIKYFKLLPNNIPTIYQWSLYSKTDILRIESVVYALVAAMKVSTRNDIFTNLLGLSCSDLLADIKNILLRFLQPTETV